jgi:hypothetical protein
MCITLIARAVRGRRALLFQRIYSPYRGKEGVLADRKEGVSKYDSAPEYLFGKIQDAGADLAPF